MSRAVQTLVRIALAMTGDERLEIRSDAHQSALYVRVVTYQHGATPYSVERQFDAEALERADPLELAHALDVLVREARKEVPAWTSWRESRRAERP